MKIEEINAACVDEDGDIYFTSVMNPSLVIASDGNDVSDWIIDSGASFHVTPHRGWFFAYYDSRKGFVRLDNNQSCEIVDIGDVQLWFQNGSSFLLKNVRHVPVH